MTKKSEMTSWSSLMTRLKLSISGESRCKGSRRGTPGRGTGMALREAHNNVGEEVEVVEVVEVVMGSGIEISRTE